MTSPGSSSFEDRALDALLDVLRYGGSPAVGEAQAIMLRRLALQGDVVASRLPAPRNITEVGGYLNLLDTLHQPDLRAEALASVLGIAGPPTPVGWTATAPALSTVSIANDRPPGAAGLSAPLSIGVRGDFAPALGAALDQIRARGSALPLSSPPAVLPPGNQPSGDVDLLAVLGRVLNLVSTAAFTDPITDPIVLARLATAPPGGYQVTTHVTPRAPGYDQVPPQDWRALTVDRATGGLTEFPLVGFRLLPVGPLLADTGFAPPDRLAAPAGPDDRAWARLVNVAGLVPGVTRLGDELALLYPPQEIAASALAPKLSWVWNGVTFAPPPAA
ncbi:hypothetical protein Lfu02_04170 [Longispora fulva]|uniref:Uncharacterized protein n=1 Tax=Longispora fulva TaxID=619741 RepID=A0A8J7GDM3_9ACTN|nr:hypothetical protein [Longispora fulva]MBG6135716.1 hypothetical protein [Longispora fulva]GIG56045.1 hypothetical protein Lfu02_04170 [Longispora fulva]